MASRSWRDERVLRRMRVEGRLSIREIADRLDTTPPTIHKWVNEFGIERPTPWRDTDLVVRMYERDRLSPSSIAERLGCHRRTIRRRLKEAGVELKGNSGEYHYRYTDGSSVGYYGSEWKQARLNAIVRDCARCVDCGILESDHMRETGKGLHVHHIRPVPEFEDPSDAHYLENLKTLCSACHARAENFWQAP